MNDYLVTGSTGFIGVNVVECLLASGHRVTGLAPDAMPALALQAFARLPGEFRQIAGDVRDARCLDELFGQTRFDGVVAAAAITAGPERERAGPSSLIDVNLVGVARAIELAEAAGVRRLVCFSSTAAAGERAFGNTPVAEDDRPEPVTLYGITKAAIEDLGRRWNSFSPGCQVVVARLSAAFGPWERSSGVRDTLSPAWQLATAAVRGEAVAPLPEGGDRDWGYAPYVAQAVEWMLMAPTLPQQLFNVGSGALWHPRMMIEALAGAGLPLAQHESGQEIAFHDDLSRRRVPLSAARIGAAFAAPPAPDQAVADYARWVAAHPDWFRSG